TRSCSAPCAVRMSTGVISPRLRISRRRISPCLSGRRRSMTTASYPDASNMLSAVWASLACSGRKPLCASARWSQAAISSSSSTSSMRIWTGFRNTGLLAAMYALTQVSVLAPTAEQNACKLVQSLSVHLALELDDGIERYPVLTPAPGVEFGGIRRAQADIGITTHHAQQKPDLLLPFVLATRIAPNEVVRNVIAQPVSCPAQYANVFGKQSHLFMQFPVHGLHRAFTILDSALRKLPCMFPYTLTPENLVLVIYQDNADIGTVAFTVQHGHL